MISFNPDIAWSVDCYGLSLIHRKTGARVSLRYPEAALWDLLSRNVGMTRIIGIMAAISALDASAVQPWCLETIQDWVDAGWLLKEQHHD